MPIRRVGSFKEGGIVTSEPAAAPVSVAPKAPVSRGKSRAAVIIIIFIIALAVAGCIWMFIKYSGAKKQLGLLSTPKSQEEELATKEANKILTKVGKLIMLPMGEEPTIATVTDANSLKSEQDFYKDVQNGDKLIVYMQAKKAIIYNEASNILVNVGPIFFTPPSPTSTPPVE